MPVLVNVVTDQFAPRMRNRRLKEGFSHTESLGSQEGERGKSTDVNEVISTLQKTIEVFRKRNVKEVISFTNVACRTSR